MERSDEIIVAAEERYKGKSNAIKLEDAFHAGARWADRHQRWRDAEKELPTPPEVESMNSEMVVVTEGNTYDIGFYNYIMERWISLNIGIKITHWAPLPELPKGDYSNS